VSKQFKKMRQGMLEAMAYSKGKSAPGTRVHHPKPVDVKSLRISIGMTQEQFAAKFGMSTATLRHWERGDRSPQGPALVLLNVIQHDPEAVIRALAA
jgi:putative transcriptional regulator